MMLHINMFCLRLTFSIFCEDNARLVVSKDGTGTNKFCYLQLIQELSDPYVLICCIFQSNVFGFGSRGWNTILFFNIPRNNGFVNEESIFYHRLSFFGITDVVTIGISNQSKWWLAGWSYCSSFWLKIGFVGQPQMHCIFQESDNLLDHFKVSHPRISVLFRELAYNKRNVGSSIAG